MTRSRSLFQEEVGRGPQGPGGPDGSDATAGHGSLPEVRPVGGTRGGNPNSTGLDAFQPVSNRGSVLGTLCVHTGDLDPEALAGIELWSHEGSAGTNLSAVSSATLSSAPSVLGTWPDVRPVGSTRKEPGESGQPVDWCLALHLLEKAETQGYKCVESEIIKLAEDIQTHFKEPSLEWWAGYAMMQCLVDESNPAWTQAAIKQLIPARAGPPHGLLKFTLEADCSLIVPQLPSYRQITSAAAATCGVTQKAPGTYFAIIHQALSPPSHPDRVWHGKSASFWDRVAVWAKKQPSYACGIPESVINLLNESEVHWAVQARTTWEQWKDETLQILSGAMPSRELDFWVELWKAQPTPLPDLSPELHERARQHAKFLQPATLDLIRSQLRKLANKAGGADGWSYAQLKLLPDEALAALLSIFRRVECEGVLPEHWLTTLITMLPKNSRVERPIALCNATYRLWAKLRYPVVESWVLSFQQQAPWEQAVPGQSTLDVSITRLLQAEISRVRKRCRIVLFVDLQTFYES
ncbi:unnamed protein product, partial [Symbiodinium sp. CCMP2592]